MSATTVPTTLLTGVKETTGIALSEAYELWNGLLTALPRSTPANARPTAAKASAPRLRPAPPREVRSRTLAPDAVVP